METKHTPGPWTAEEKNGRGMGWQAGPAWLGEKAWDEECAANARLISAAPELLEAVDRMLTWNHGGQRAEDVAFARRVYAKALGHDG